MLEQARRLTVEQGLTNVTFEHADAQVRAFEPDRFDVCISRFGTMFFADPVTAFANIGTAMRPSSRLVMLVWQARDRNEWATVIRDALLGTHATPPAGGPDPFSLADPSATAGILTAAGFADVTFADVHEPVHYGRDVDAALDAVLRLLRHGELLVDLDASAAEQARARLRAMLVDHATESGVRFDSRAWLVTAGRR